jgi:hypothetical protein
LKDDEQIFASKEKSIKNELTLDALQQAGLHRPAALPKQTTKRVRARV